MACTESLLGMEYVYVVIGYLFDTSMFWLDLSWKLGLGEVIFKGPLVSTGLCMFCLPILYAYPILLAMVDELWYYAGISKLLGLKTYAEYFDIYRFFFDYNPIT